MNSRNEHKLAEASRETLWSLLSEKKYTICIPRIQRDYAQGRREPEPTQIRQTFLKDVFNSLVNKKPLDINFIYGNIDVDTKGVQRFVPIDGQQRLTTLFLLHWYFGAWAEKLDANNKEVLSRFQYETRFVTGDFCNRLVNEVNVNLKELANAGGNITEIIKDYYWFFSAYERDATISAMLVMLDEIHNTVKSLPDTSAVNTFFETLIDENGPISFLFLDINDVGLTDEIYIKMNARGKALTRFENFKAQLTSYLSKKDEEFSRKIIGRINGEWSQFFWHEEYRPDVRSKSNRKAIKKSSIFDDQIMNLFRFIMLNEYICNVELEDTADAKNYIRKVVGSLVEENDFQFVNHLFYDEFRSVSLHTSDEPVVDERVFHYIFKLLNTLSRKKEEDGNIIFTDDTLYSKEYINEENYFRRLIRASSERELSYEDEVLLYAEFCFLVKYADDDYSFDKTSELTEWMRFVYNLTRSVRYNTIDDYFRSIRGVREIIDNEEILDVLTYAATLLRRDYKQGSGYGFVERQVAEECIKANLMKRGAKWRELITQAENSFLGNQLHSILSFSGIWTIYDLQMSEFEFANPKMARLPQANAIMQELDENDQYYNSLSLYFRKINKIFDKENIKPELENQSLFRRALLTFGGEDSYMLPPRKEGVKCFLDATDRDTSFRRLLGGDYPKNSSYFKELLDTIDDKEDMVTQLNRIIENTTFDGDSRWKKYFVEMPEILDCMYQNKESKDPSGEYVFKNPKRFICMRDADKILLLERTITTSINREYYSYVLFLKSKKQGYDVKYSTTCYENSEKFLHYTNKQGEEVQVLYMLDESSDEYKYIAREGDIIRYKGDIDNMLDYIQQTFM